MPILANVANTDSNDIFKIRINQLVNKTNEMDVTIGGGYGYANTVNIAADAAFAKSNASNTIMRASYGWGNSVMGIVSSAFTQANVANINGVGAFAEANSAIVYANIANLTHVISSGTVYSRNKLNLIGGTDTYINVTDDASGKVNINVSFVASGQDSSGRDMANAAFDYANTISGQANTLFGTANGLSINLAATFDSANMANTVLIGYTPLGGSFAYRSSKNKINFIPGASVTINVNDWAAGDASNISVATTVSDVIAVEIARATFNRANGSNAHTISTFNQANTINIIVGSAYTQANTKLANTNGAVLVGNMNIKSNLYVTRSISAIGPVSATNMQPFFTTQSRVTINNASEALFPSFSGLMLITEISVGASALYYNVGGGVLLVDHDGLSNWADVSDGTQYCFYYSGSGTNIRLRNNSGSAKTFSILSFKNKHAFP